MSAIQRYAPPQDALPSLEFFHPLRPPSNRQILCLYTDNKSSRFIRLFLHTRITSISNREQGIYERDFMNVYSFFQGGNEIIPIFKVYLVRMCTEIHVTSLLLVNRLLV